MMMVNRKKVLAMVLAGVISFGFVGTSFTAVTEAAEHEAAYEDGTHNKYSHRLQEEERNHRQNVLSLRYKKRYGQIDDKEYEKRMKKEQERHDQAVKDIKADYEKHKSRHKD